MPEKQWFPIPLRRQLGSHVRSRLPADREAGDGNASALGSRLTLSTWDWSLLKTRAQDLPQCCDFPRIGIIALQRENQARLVGSFRGFQAATHRNATKPKEDAQVVVSQVVQSTAALTILSFFG